MIIDDELMIVFKSSGIGDSQPDLGETLMSLFLNQVFESGMAPSKMVFMNTAIFLTTEGSKYTELLKKFEEAGTEILSCGTCLDYFGRKEKVMVGKSTNMKETARAMLSFKKVITL
jgi:selenium metabolism protein YedF